MLVLVCVTTVEAEGPEMRILRIPEALATPQAIRISHFVLPCFSGAPARGYPAVLDERNVHSGSVLLILRQKAYSACMPSCAPMTPTGSALLSARRLTLNTIKLSHFARSNIVCSRQGQRCCCATRSASNRFPAEGWVL